MSATMDGEPILRTRRLSLRRWRYDDAAELAEIDSDPEVTRYLNPPVTPAARFTERCVEHWEKHGFGFFAVELHEEPTPGRFIGFVGIGHPAFLPELAARPELGWRLARDAWGRGLATEAAVAVCEDAFGRLGLDGIAVTPDGSRVYAVNSGNNSVSAIDTATDTVVATIKVGNVPTAIAITPDGSHAYVTNTRAGTVSVIDTATNEVDARAIKVGRDPLALVVAPDGGRVYVANIHDDTVSVIRTTTNSVASRRIRTGKSPISVAITPDGRRLYIANAREDTVSVISTRTGRSAAAPIPVAHRPTAIAINPVADRAYMTGMGPGTLSVIDTKTDKLVGEPVEVGPFPLAIAVAPDGRRAYIVHN